MDKHDFYLEQAYRKPKNKMSYRNSSLGAAGAVAGVGVGCVGVIMVWLGYLIVWGGLAAILAFWTNRSLDFWVTYVKHVDTHVPYVIAWLASLPLPLSFFANIATEVARFFL